MSPASHVPTLIRIPAQAAKGFALGFVTAGFAALVATRRRLGGRKRFMPLAAIAGAVGGLAGGLVTALWFGARAVRG